MKTTVIHHSADFDGIFCREIARKFLPEAELIGWDFGDAKVPMPMEGVVYILDLPPSCLQFGFDPETTEAEGRTTYKLDEFDSRLIWIDHHKSSIDKWPVVIPGYRIDGVAACRLAWQWFSMGAKPVYPHLNPQDPCLPRYQEFINRTVIEPLAVRLAGEYDVWDKRDPRVEIFQHGLASVNLSSLEVPGYSEPISWWDDMLRSRGLTPSEDYNTDAVERLLERGEIVKFMREQENEFIIKRNGFTIQFAGLNFLACNHARFNSTLFTAGIKPEHDALLGFRWDGKQWNVSLYHAPGKEHHDLSLIAVKYGGGGHQGACGFRAEKLPFLP